MWQKVSNWKHRFLSQAGQEELIKAVLQAIPVYTMSPFRLPKSLCKDLEMLIANFWWGLKDNEPKLHLMNWMRMGKSKVSGSLGFKNLQVSMLRF